MTQTHWLWLIGGLLPYYVKRQRKKDEWLLCVYALFWHLTIRQQEKQVSWSLFFPWGKHAQ